MTRRSTVLLAWLGWVTFVVYGSLVPLDYTPRPWEQAVAAFRTMPFLQLGIASRADWIANGVLYAPLGFLSARLLRAWVPRLPHAVALPLAFVACVALAVGVEFTQLFFPPRTVSQNDLMAEAIGSAVGVLLAPVLAGWLARLGAYWRVGGGRLCRHLLEGYAVAYGLLCFFPYDFLLSGLEVQEKWASGPWGWVLAPHERGLLFALLQLVVETGLAAPLGMLLARGRGGVPRALGVGAVCGLVIEVGQFFVASGLSQGASVLTRAAGMGLGAALVPRLGRAGAPMIQAEIGRHAGWLALAYLPVLLFVNGWFRDPWHGLAEAAAAWRELHLLPFYYHYLLSESRALFSLGSVALMYLPAALVGWALGIGRVRVLAGVALLTLAVETVKLFITGMRPDSTNLLIAPVACAAFLGLLELSSRARAPAGPATEVVPRAAPAWPWPKVLLPFVLVGAGLGACWFPAFPVGVLGILGAAAVTVWMRPVWALAVIPAALPVLDLAPWSGRFYWDEFDLLQAVCIAVALARTQAPLGGFSRRLQPVTVAFVLLALSLSASTLIALWPWQGLDPNSFSSYNSPYNALRIVKGGLWAWLWVLLWQRMADRGPARGQALSAGMAAGLALTVAFVLWERANALSLLDTTSNFRVSGPMAAMQKGGAYLECWLAVAAAFVMTWVVRTPSLPGRLFGLALLAATGYAVMVTFSRNGYVALLVALVLAALFAVRAQAGLPAPALRQGRLGWRLAMASLALAVVAAAAVPVLRGDFARERLAQTAPDLATRQAHWADALRLRDPGLATFVFGMGVGRFPESHYRRSAEPLRAAAYRLASEGDNTYLRMGGGARLYIDQILPDPGSDELVLSMDLRSNRDLPTLVVTVCRKWGVTSQACVPGQATATAAPGKKGAWQSAVLRLDVAQVRASAGPFGMPMRFSLHTPGDGTVVEVDNVRLAALDGREMLANGDFSAGMDHWLFATDINPPWHTDSLPLAVLFDQGWFGVFAWGLVVVLALARGLQLVWRGQAQVPAALAGLAAFLASGTLNTLIDAPRFLALLLLLLWLAAADDRQGESPAA